MGGTKNRAPIGGGAGEGPKGPTAASKKVGGAGEANTVRDGGSNKIQLGQIGAAHGIGRPRWESLGRAIDENGLDCEDLIGIAKEARENAETSMVVDDVASTNDTSIQAFLAVEKAVTKAIKPAKSPSPAPPSSVPLKIGGKRGGTVKRTAKGLSIELAGGDFADWVETQVHDMIEDLHERWKQRSED